MIASNKFVGNLPVEVGLGYLVIGPKCSMITNFSTSHDFNQVEFIDSHLTTQ